MTTATTTTTNTALKKRVVVVCPGRGTYTKETLGYLRPARDKYGEQLRHFDELRAQLQMPTLTEMDEAPLFQPGLHTKGEHASPLIYACSLMDFQALNRNSFEIVAITGNSMGWYTTLALAGALPGDCGFEVIQTMGSMMKDGILGGQVIYPVVGDNWVLNAGRIKIAQNAVNKINSMSESPQVFISIRLGGYLVFGATNEGVSQLLKELPKSENFPFQLVNHAAFHTPLLKDVSERAFQSLSVDLFAPPQIPMIDGRGAIWQPHATDVNELYQYTLGHQVTQTYDYSKAIEVAVKEFAPHHVVLLGPGQTLGGATAQALIQQRWRGMTSKEDFTTLQKTTPFLLSFGMPEQRRLLI